MANTRDLHLDHLLEQIIVQLREEPVPQLADPVITFPADVKLAQSPTVAAPRTRRPVSLFPYRLSRAVIRYSLAAAIIVAIGLMITNGGNSTVLALSEVAQSVREHKLVRFKQEITTSPEKAPGIEGISTVYVDLQRGCWRTEKDAGHDGTTIFIEDYSNCKVLLVNPKERKASLTLLPAEGTKPGPMLEELDKLRENKNTKVTKEKLNGRDVLVYRLENKLEPPPPGSTVEPSSQIMWVNPETKLPVRIESVFVYLIPKSNVPSEVVAPNPTPIKIDYTVEKMRVISSDFVWDPELTDPEALFRLDPPEGYIVEIIDNTKPRVRIERAEPQ